MYKNIYRNDINTKFKTLEGKMEEEKLYTGVLIICKTAKLVDR